MQYKAQLIVPKGRTEYGNYLSQGNVTKMVNGAVYGGNNTTTELNPPVDNPSTGNPEDKNETNWSVFLSKTYNTFDSIKVAAGEGEDTVYVIGYKGTSSSDTFIGDLDNSGAVNHGITGITEGMTVTVQNNGTNSTSIYVQLESTIPVSEGTLYIPVYVNISKILNEVGTDFNNWKDNEASTVKNILQYSWKLTSNSNIYNLDLTNENAGVNVNSAGTIYSASTASLACEAQLYLGTEPVTSATYSLSILPKYNCTGVTINANTGVFTFNPNLFRFDGNNLPISVLATVEGETVGTKTMNINKNWPGANGKDGEDGADAVTKWIVLSSNAAKVDVNNNPIPSSITAYVMVQIGGEAPVISSSDTIYYSFDNVSPVTVLPTTGATVLTGSSKINFVLRKGNTTSGEIYESETVPILREVKGADGKKGEDGRAGAAIRGPIKWEDGGNRRWCNGQGPTTEDTQWIDIIIYNGNYYKCITSYDGTTSQTWSQVSSYWQQVDNAYKFIASEVLLANNASIDFLTNNEIYLKNAQGQITGGARGSDSANTVNFWAGSNSPSNAPFQVFNDGSINATKGTFAGYVQMPYTHISELTETEVGSRTFVADSRANIVCNMVGGNIHLILPIPSSAYNGVTYHVLVIATDRTKTGTTYPELYIETTASTDYFVTAIYGTNYEHSNNLGFYGGQITITCMPYQSNLYRWVLTESTGGVDIYDGETYRCSLNTVVSFSNYGHQNTVNKINTDYTIPSDKEQDTLYISRN